MSSFPGATGRWEMRRTTFRQEGRPHQLLVLADVSRPLRDEERQAWQRLIRVIGHEINNSLAPIKSIAGSLESMLARTAGNGSLSGDLQDDMKRGLAVIASRSDALSRFTTAYAQLAKLPAPRLATVRIPEFVARAAGVETRVAVRIDAGPDVVVRADPDQLEQLVINLLRNAADAALETGGERQRRLAPRRTHAERLDRRSKALACRMHPTCSCRSSRPSPAVRASASSSAARSPRRTADRSRSKTVPTDRVAARCCACRSRCGRSRTGSSRPSRTPQAS